MRIFLIAGKARSGKDEIAKIIKEYYDKRKEKTVITAYSKYLKVYAKEMIEWNGKEEEKPRQFLQDMGYFIRNNLNLPSFLINRMQEDIKIYSQFFNNCIISDVRYPEEIEKIRKNYPQTYVFFVINEHGNYDLTKKEASHETEHALDNYNDFDYVIVNDERAIVKRKIEEILNEISEKEN